MGRSKITLLELGERLRQGKTKAEIAAEFGMTVRGVQKKASKLDIEVSKAAALHQGGIILSQQIDANAQLLKINESVNRSLGLLEARLLYSEDGEEKLNHAVVDQQLRAIAEVRKQLELLAKVAADWLEAKRLAAVYEAIIGEIGRESPECRNRIIRRLGGLQSAGLLFGLDGPSV
jgi:uncharacterized coiled-coil protein SlyX